MRNEERSLHFGRLEITPFEIQFFGQYNSTEIIAVGELAFVRRLPHHFGDIGMINAKWLKETS